MRFRATLASVLTVMMLSFSSFASNCEVRCDLKSVVGTCHGAPHTGQHDAMSAMAGMNHAKAKPDTGAGPAFASPSADCRHHVCAQQPVLNEQQAALTHIVVSVGLVPPVSLQFASDPVFEVSFARGPPPFSPATPVSLHTTLLI